jgi:malate dehydrogenase (oxaloacetate-decarboxylating)(NADP+)
MFTRKQALEYHSRGRKGKLEVVPTKPCLTQVDLSLAYTPGVAEPCREIERHPDDVFEYTQRGNLVAVVTDGSAVLGLGNIGPLASKPVMEGKGVLFKRFADIDTFDLELDTNDPDVIVNVTRMLEPTFGGVNLEDIKAPECFYIEEELKKVCSIPIFHDDQHGTAIISGAAFLNAVELAGKRLEDVKVVFSGAGAAGIACARLYIALGVQPENVLMVDSRGVVYEGREEGMNPYKAQLARSTERRSLADAMVGADVFVGVSLKDLLTPEMLSSMADDPIVFAMANPDPEITWEAAHATRDDLIMATGRSDYPNQVNNVLGFPFIFRGALDVRACDINEEMKVAATHALAQLAKEDVPDSVCAAYGVAHLEFGREYIIPKPFDPRVLYQVAPAVAKAAMESGVAQQRIKDLEEYRAHLKERLDPSQTLMHRIFQIARLKPKRIVFSDGESELVLRACRLIHQAGIAEPVVLGNAERIASLLERMDVPSDGLEVVDPGGNQRLQEYIRCYHELRFRRGVTRSRAEHLLTSSSIHFALMMLRKGDADAVVLGLKAPYPDVIRPALQMIGLDPSVKRLMGMSMITDRRGKPLFFADCLVNQNPSAEELANIAIQAADAVRACDIEPRVAFMSFSNFGSVDYANARKVRRAVDLAREARPDIILDGEMQPNLALDSRYREEHYPFSALRGPANVLVFPDLDAASISSRLATSLTGRSLVGPILLGLEKPVAALPQGCNVDEIVNLTAFAAIRGGADLTWD